MNRALSISLLFFLLFMFSVPAFGRSMVTGQVVDAETGKPIENAAVYICWTKPGAGPPGLAGEDIVEVAETLTDSEGSFKIPKYSTFLKQYEFTVYKNGYVCWNSRDIFPTYQKRKDFRIKDGMVIKLEHFKEEYSKEKHAIFTTVSSSWSKGVFDQAIQSEKEIRRKIFMPKTGDSK
ncbi:MAG: carboxypeptidase-like regulatory domain-containing protein [Proteobacteria bacterium]|nr:carboxypeptidase-like regulatory domain-containing protein [Pseudomonadota bacterium]